MANKANVVIEGEKPSFAELTTIIVRRVVTAFEKSASVKKLVEKVGVEYQLFILEHFGNEAVFACASVKGNDKAVFFAKAENKVWSDMNDDMKSKTVENTETGKKGCQPSTYSSRISRWITEAGKTAGLALWKVEAVQPKLEEEKILEEKRDNAPTGKKRRELERELGKISDEILAIEDATEIPPVTLTVAEVTEHVRNHIIRTVKFINKQDATSEEIEMHKQTLIKLGDVFNYEVVKEDSK
mgnify:CR=1 FL=1